jgi:large subunit ribosomal protein L32
MAVPKKKVSKSRRNMRRAHNALKPINAYGGRVSHQVSPVDGTYNGRQVIEVKGVSKGYDEMSNE